ncbi:MAG TPA: serine hydroxymethyltransferase [Pyrinomonadaceae bacterium]
MFDDYRIQLKASDPEVFSAIAAEENRQREGIELIPSENYTYPEVLAALGSVLTNKYSEGYPGRRYYGGQENTDTIENLARDRACRLFRGEHANVQPLSGSPMNQAVYLAYLKPGDTILGMDLSHGGHLTHGAPVSHMGKLFNFVRYKSRPEDRGSIDFDALMQVAKETRPKIVLCGYTSYPRDYDYQSFRTVADEVGALAMADVSHVGGLIAGEAMRNPFDSGFDIVTTTTHKSLRGPRAGLILCKKSEAKILDSSVFPGLQGGPHMNAIAGAAITFQKAFSQEFKDYCAGTLRNAKQLAASLLEEGVDLITGGTDNHMLVIDTVKSFEMDGKASEKLLDRVGLTTNKQIIPDDPNPPLRPSGIRLGTPACTTRGMKESDMTLIANWIVKAFRHKDSEETLAKIADEVRQHASTFPVPGLAPRDASAAR